MGNYPPPPPPPPPQIVIIRPEPQPPQPNPFDQVLLRKMIEQLVLEAINKHLALQRGGWGRRTMSTDDSSGPGELLALKSMESGEAMENRTPDVGIPEEIRDRLMDRGELMEYLEMDIPPGAMPAISAALARASLRD